MGSCVNNANNIPSAVSGAEAERNMDALPKERRKEKVRDANAHRISIRLRDSSTSVMCGVRVC